MRISEYNANRGKIRFKKKIRILSSGAIAGKTEGEGPLANYFDEICNDPLFGEKTFEKAESLMCTKALRTALSKAMITEDALDFILAGDLMNQCTGSTYGLSDYDVPYLGIYGACSTFAQGLVIGSMLIESGCANAVAVCASSHFCSAERQFRFPTAYGSFGSSTAQNTVTGAGCIILCDGEAFEFDNKEKAIYVTEAIPGIVVDRGINDAANMGAAMCSAAADTIIRYADGENDAYKDFDFVASGDLGWEGVRLMTDILGDDSPISPAKLRDCGLLVYDIKKQNVGLGGSGCGCSAIVSAGYFLSEMRCGNLHKIGIMGTGAMMSPKSVDQGESIPGIAHMVTVESRNEV